MKIRKKSLGEEKFERILMEIFQWKSGFPQKRSLRSFLGKEKNKRGSLEVVYIFTQLSGLVEINVSSGI